MLFLFLLYDDQDYALVVVVVVVFVVVVVVVDICSCVFTVVVSVPSASFSCGPPSASSELDGGNVAEPLPDGSVVPTRCNHEAGRRRWRR